MLIQIPDRLDKHGSRDNIRDSAVTLFWITTSESHLQRRDSSSYLETDQMLSIISANSRILWTVTFNHYDHHPTIQVSTTTIVYNVYASESVFTRSLVKIIDYANKFSILITPQNVGGPLFPGKFGNRLLFVGWWWSWIRLRFLERGDHQTWKTYLSN